MRETDIANISWDYSIQENRKIKPNKLDIFIEDKKEKICKPTDVKILAEKNISVAEFEKLSKYQDLKIEVEKLRHMKIVTIPDVTGVLGLIMKSTQNYLERVAGNPNLHYIREIVLTGTAHIFKKLFYLFYLHFTSYLLTFILSALFTHIYIFCSIYSNLYFLPISIYIVLLYFFIFFSIPSIDMLYLVKALFCYFFFN